jgi:hypothetical protein
MKLRAPIGSMLTDPVFLSRDHLSESASSSWLIKTVKINVIHWLWLVCIDKIFAPSRVVHIMLA